MTVCDTVLAMSGMKRRQQIKEGETTMKLHAFVLTALLALCGHAAVAQEADPATIGVTITGFKLSGNVIEVPANGRNEFSVIWQTKGAAPLGLYAVAGYVYSAEDKARKPADSNRFFVRNCSVASSCGNQHEESCSMGSNGRISCSVGSGVNIKPGRYVAVARACFYERSMKEVCSEQESLFTVR